jgi:hypothetical protein
MEAISPVAADDETALAKSRNNSLHEVGTDVITFPDQSQTYDQGIAKNGA